MAGTRVTETLMFNKSQETMARTRDKMVRTQEEASTMKRINKPSDDPMAMLRATTVKVSKDRAAQVQKNLELAGNVLNMTDASLGELTEVLSRAKEIAIQMSSGSNQTEDARLAVAREVEQLGMRAVQIGNTRLGDRYLFSGFQTERAPFDEHGNYYGDAGEIHIEMQGGQKVLINTPGSMPFYGINELASVKPESKEKEGDDKAVPGAPTPSISGELRSPSSIIAQNRGLDPTKPETAQKMQEMGIRQGVNIFAVIKDFHEGLNSGNRDKINGAIDGIDAAFKQVISSRAVIGAQQNLVQLGISSLDDQQVSAADTIAKIEDADTVKVFSELSRNENLLKTTLAANSKMITPSLLEFLK